MRRGSAPGQSGSCPCLGSVLPSLDRTARRPGMTSSSRCFSWMLESPRILGRGSVEVVLEGTLLTQHAVFVLEGVNTRQDRRSSIQTWRGWKARKIRDKRENRWKNSNTRKRRGFWGGYRIDLCQRSSSNDPAQDRPGIFDSSTRT